MPAKKPDNDYSARNKNDLMIEIWERLDCESIGAAEIEAIELGLSEVYGEAAVDSPMVIARLLADEGAELRHHEIMKLYVERNSETRYDAELRNLIDISSLRSVSRSISQMENLRRKLLKDEDKKGLRLLREKAIRFKDKAHENSLKPSADKGTRLRNAEIAEWLTIWLRTPEIFDNWKQLRLRSPEFAEWFGDDLEDA